MLSLLVLLLALADSPLLAFMNKPRFCLLRLKPDENVIGFCRCSLRDADICSKEDTFLSDALRVSWRIDVLDRFADVPQFLRVETAFFPYFSHKRFFRRFAPFRAAAWKEAATRRLHDSNAALGVTKKRVGAWAWNVSLTWNTRTKLRNFHIVAHKLS